MFSVIGWCKPLWNKGDLWCGGHLCLGLERRLLLLGHRQQRPPLCLGDSPESPGEGIAGGGEQQQVFLMTGKKQIPRSSLRRARSRI